MYSTPCASLPAKERPCRRQKRLDRGVQRRWGRQGQSRCACVCVCVWGGGVRKGGFAPCLTAAALRLQMTSNGTGSPPSAMPATCSLSAALSLCPACFELLKASARAMILGVSTTCARACVCVWGGGGGGGGTSEQGTADAAVPHSPQQSTTVCPLPHCASGSKHEPAHIHRPLCSCEPWRQVQCVRLSRLRCTRSSILFD